MRSVIVVIVIVFAWGAIAGCAASAVQARYATLRNPAYPGDPNAEEVVYWARDRAAGECGWDRTMVERSYQAGAALWRRGERVDFSGAWEAFFECLARHGWVGPEQP